MTGAAKRAYPRKDVIERTVAAAKACGLDVAGFEVTPDGSIRIMEARAVPVIANDFDRWQDRL